MPGDEKAPRSLSGDLHAEDASYADVDSVAGGSLVSTTQKPAIIRPGLGAALTAAKLWCRPSPGVQSAPPL